MDRDPAALQPTHSHTSPGSHRHTSPAREGHTPQPSVGQPSPASGTALFVKRRSLDVSSLTTTMRPPFFSYCKGFRDLVYLSIIVYICVSLCLSVSLCVSLCLSVSVFSRFSHADVAANGPHHNLTPAERSALACAVSLVPGGVVDLVRDQAECLVASWQVLT